MTTSLRIALLALVMTGACRSNRVAPAGKVSLGIAIPSYVHAVAWIADDKGLFAKHKIDARVQVMGGSAATMRGLLANSIDVGLAGGDAVIKANLAGADLVVVAGLVNRFYHRLIARAEVKTPADLRGKKIGLAFLGGPQDMAVKYALRKFGLGYGSDVKVLNLGKEFNRMAAMARGDIHATTSQTPVSRLAKLGFHVLADLPAWNVPFPYAVVVVKRSYLTKRRATLVRFLAALCQASDSYRKDEAGSLRIIQNHLRGSDTEAAAHERYRLAGPSMISYPPVASTKAFANVVEFIGARAAGKVDVKKLVDPSLVDELIRAGRCGGKSP